MTYKSRGNEYQHKTYNESSICVGATGSFRVKLSNCSEEISFQVVHVQTCFTAVSSAAQSAPGPKAGPVRPMLVSSGSP